MEHNVRVHPDLPQGRVAPPQLKTRPEDQPLPTESDSPSMHYLVSADIMTRMQLGISRYGKALQANNGRDALRDMYEELLDAAAYTRQLLYERDGR